MSVGVHRVFGDTTRGRERQSFTGAQDLARLAQEPVVAAMQRLAEQYDMLKRDTLLNAAVLIDNLETLFSERFREHYAALKAQENSSS